MDLPLRKKGCIGMKLILLGAPGAGKGTQAEVICENKKIPAISTGNILREALKNGTEMGLRAKSYMESGALVPDEILIGIIKDRIKEEDCKNGFILDGFPRTIPQAEALDGMGADIDVVLDIEVADEDIVTRMSGRRVCAACGSSYNVEFVPPRREGVCDNCGGKLIQRKDDTPETVRERLKVYHTETEPLVGFYAQRGLLRPVQSADTKEGTTQAILAALGIEK